MLKRVIPLHGVVFSLPLIPSPNFCELHTASASNNAVLSACTIRKNVPHLLVPVGISNYSGFFDKFVLG